MQSSSPANALSFSVFHNASNRETSFLSKQLHFPKSEIVTFSQKDFSKYLLVLSNFLFLITTSWRQILFLISYFLKINTFSAELPFRRSVPSRISNYSENALFRSRHFFRTFQKKNFFRRRYFLKRVTFYDSSVPVDAGRKLNVLCTFNLRPVSTRV